MWRPERESVEQSVRKMGGWTVGEEVRCSPGSMKGSHDAQSRELKGTRVSRVVAVLSHFSYSDVSTQHTLPICPDSLRGAPGAFLGLGFGRFNKGRTEFRST